MASSAAGQPDVRRVPGDEQGDARAASGAAGPAAGAYAVVHLVVQEATKELIATQVIDHMATQRAAPGADAPSRVIVGLLEPARVALGARLRTRVKELRARAPQVDVVVLPYVSRLAPRQNARMIAARLRRHAAGLRVVFHCRSERAAEWASELRRFFPGAAVVVDVRGVWPHELLHARGFDAPEEADAASRDGYNGALAALDRAVRESDAVQTVSEPLAEWLVGRGARADAISVVPCCVLGLTFSADARAALRAELGVEERLVFAYVGSITRYQHIEDGLIPFFIVAADACPEAHLLCVTTEPERMSRLLDDAGIAPGRRTVVRVPQHDVGRYLSAADCGLLLRAPSLVNRVSMPVKLGEYLAAGLPVVSARIAEGVDRAVVDAGAGLVVEWFGASPAVRAAEAARVCRTVREHASAMRERALELAERRFLWSSYTRTVRDTYRRALAAAARG